MSRILAAVVAAMVVTSLPVFLTGALSPLLADELSIDTARTGSAVAAFFVVGALASLPAGRLVDRVGAGFGLRTAIAAAGLLGLLVATTSRSFVTLLLPLAAGGIALALADTGSARALATAVPRHRQGMAFGTKEASIPTASLVAGLAVPLLGTTLGWRAAYASVAALALLGVLVVPRRLDRPSTTAAREPAADRPRALDRPSTTASPEPAGDPRELDRPSTIASPEPAGAGTAGAGLLMLSVAAGLAGGAAAALATFLVPGLVDAGLSVAVAGFVLSAASVVAIGTRLAVGRLADTRPGSELRVLRRLLVGGALGLTILALGTSAAGPGTAGFGTDGPGAMATVLLVGGAVAALGSGWGWTGLVFLAAVRSDPARPARAAGIVLVGLGLGGSLGPGVLGAVAGSAGYVVSWTTGVVALTLAAALVTLGRATPRGPRRPRRAAPGDRTARSPRT